MLRKRKPRKTPRSQPATVYVVGAGFSAALGYPLTRELLTRLWPRLDESLQDRLERVLQFHHPGFRRKALETMPDIEEFLTELDANEHLLLAVRRRGPFGVEEIKAIRDDLLHGIATWFHEIHEQGKNREHGELAERFAERVRTERASVISFNWDLEIDARVGDPSPRLYGVDGEGLRGVLLKPHGSLSWYEELPSGNVKEKHRIGLWRPKTGGKRRPIYAFLHPRAPRGRHRHVPWIVPPTHLKTFRHPMLRRIWTRCMSVLGTARRVFVLGYSLPVADWHSRYILRCGFHSQVEGLPRDDGTRRTPTGRAKVVVVNPDPAAARRLREVVGGDLCWMPQRVEEWLSS